VVDPAAHRGGRMVRSRRALLMVGLVGVIWLYQYLHESR